MKVLIITNSSRDKDLTVTGKIIRQLNRYGIEVLNPAPDSCSLYSPSVLSLIPQSDMLIVIGGDGTILRVSQFAYISAKPILGVNVGNIGYMTSIESSELDMLEKLSDPSGYCIEKRMLLNAKVKDESGNIIFNENALNEIVISHGNVSRILNFDVLCNGRLMSKYRADGIIFSTPTGSTAYSLSAGGPIIDAGLDSIVATPICAHSFNSRSIVFRPDTEISVNVGDDDLFEGNVYITSDGLKNMKLPASYAVFISRSEYSIGLVRLKNESFYDVLSRKIK